MSIELVILSNHLFTLISFRIDWFDLLATQGTQKTLLLKALQFETISSLVLSLLYGPVLTLVCGYWKSHSFDLWSFVGKVMFPLLNMLSRFIIVFLQRSKDLLFHGFSHHPQWFESLRKENLSLIPLFPPTVWHEETGHRDLIRLLNVEFQASFFTLLSHPYQEALQFLFTFCC